MVKGNQGKLTVSSVMSSGRFSARNALANSSSLFSISFLRFSQCRVRKAVFRHGNNQLFLRLLHFPGEALLLQVCEQTIDRFGVHAVGNAECSVLLYGAVTNLVGKTGCFLVTRDGVQCRGNPPPPVSGAAFGFNSNLIFICIYVTCLSRPNFGGQ